MELKWRGGIIEHGRKRFCLYLASCNFIGVTDGSGLMIFVLNLFSLSIKQRDLAMAFKNKIRVVKQAPKIKSGNLLMQITKILIFIALVALVGAQIYSDFDFSMLFAPMM